MRPGPLLPPLDPGCALGICVEAKSIYYYCEADMVPLWPSVMGFML